jgi:uncharacterized damage-inducible protein DinB
MEGDQVADAAGLLTEQLADSSSKILQALAEITDDEFFWEPCAGCWTLHHRSEALTERPDGAGNWVLDGKWDPPPHPAPVTTIAWRTVHVAAINYVYWDYAFGPATATFDLEMPSNAQDAVAWLAASQQPLLATLRTLHDEELDRPRRTNWGEQWPTSRHFTTLINEQVHHGAEISLLRDLYRNRATLGMYAKRKSLG